MIVIHHDGVRGDINRKHGRQQPQTLDNPFPLMFEVNTIKFSAKNERRTQR